MGMFDFILDLILGLLDKRFSNLKYYRIIGGGVIFFCIVIIGLLLYDYVT